MFHARLVCAHATRTEGLPFGVLLLSVCALLGILGGRAAAAESADAPAESSAGPVAGQIGEGGGAVAAAPVATVVLPQGPSPVFEKTAAEMDALLRSATPPAAGAYDYPQYAVLARLVAAAGKLVEARDTEAFPDFRPGGEWYDLTRGRYVAVYEQDGRCVFDASAPYRVNPEFQLVLPQPLFQDADLGRLVWRFGVWRNPQTGAYARQVTACLPVRTVRNRSLLVCLAVSAELLPFDRAFAVSITEEAAALVARLGDQALGVINGAGEKPGPFTPLPGVGVLVADWNGTLLADSRNPALAGHNFRQKADAEGNNPYRQIMQKLRQGSVWYCGTINAPRTNEPQFCALHLQSVMNDKQAVKVEKRYIVGCLMNPARMTQAQLAGAVPQYDTLIRALATAYADPFAQARALCASGLRFQGALMIPSGSADGVESRGGLARLYGARLADFCYAAAFDEASSSLKAAELADQLWREKFQLGDRIEALGSLSLVRLLDDAPERPVLTAAQTRERLRRILDNTLYGEVHLQTGLEILYGNFVEGLFIGSRLAMTGKPGQATAGLELARQQGRALNGLVGIGLELRMPQAQALEQRLDGVREILLKDALNPADLARLREEAARMRIEMLRDN